MNLEEAFQATISEVGHKLDVRLFFIPIDEMFQLNNQFRMKPGPTDVLSFPDDDSYGGDVMICPTFILQTDFIFDQRMLHLWVHALLHLSGFTHDTDTDFNQMSQKEVSILKQLNQPNPYD